MVYVREKIKMKGGAAVTDEQIVALYFSRDETAVLHTREKYGRYCYRIALNILSNDAVHSPVPVPTR